jgi:hypothetical protein
MNGTTYGFLEKTRTWDCFRPSHSGVATLIMFRLDDVTRNWGLLG